MEVDQTFVSFLRQAGLCSGALGMNVRICRVPHRVRRDGSCGWSRRAAEYCERLPVRCATISALRGFASETGTDRRVPLW